ncbi:MAG TPA: phosphatase PAP2 family protein [Dehalococcoidia bacterium]|nr:phosphatase PAP2 family protein [Dehalococcoidia bacterium]
MTSYIQTRAAPAITRAASAIWRNGLCELLIIICAFMLYSVVRMGSHDRQVEATYNAVDLVHLQRTLWLAHEADIQKLILWSDFLIGVFNTIYTYGHFWLIGLAAIWLFYFHRGQYMLFRNAFFAAGAISLFFFNVMPLAPPRLLPGDYGAVDTLRFWSDVNYESSGNFVNEYAAMPSLHIAWNLLISMAIASVTTNRAIRVWCYAMPLIMTATVVVTGNHWILDAIAGYVVAMVGLGVAILLRNEGWRVRQWLASPSRTASA